MARIAGVPAREAGRLVKLAYFFTRRQFARLTGRETERETERMTVPLKMYTHVPGLLRGVAGLEQATAKLHRLDERLKYLAELKAATLTHCEFCIDLGSQVVRRSGLSDEQLLALPSYRTSALFTDLEKLVLDYAVGMSRTPVEVPDALFAELSKDAPHAIRGIRLAIAQIAESDDNSDAARRGIQCSNFVRLTRWPSRNGSVGPAR